MDQQTGEKLLTALTLVLARQIKADKAARGVRTTSDCVQDAADMINQRHDEILRLLLRT